MPQVEQAIRVVEEFEEIMKKEKKTISNRLQEKLDQILYVFLLLIFSRTNLIKICSN
jgi:hypothetical protein